jgi:hypothetical protein
LFVCWIFPFFFFLPRFVYTSNPSSMFQNSQTIS